MQPPKSPSLAEDAPGPAPPSAGYQQLWDLCLHRLAARVFLGVALLLQQELGQTASVLGYAGASQAMRLTQLFCVFCCV